MIARRPVTVDTVRSAWNTVSQTVYTLMQCVIINNYPSHTHASSLFFPSGDTELTCHCGRTVLPPPIPCGRLLPLCPHSCTRWHPCKHHVRHGCHSDDVCPPCTSLVEKMCMGGHEVRQDTMPLYMAGHSFRSAACNCMCNGL